MEISVKIQTGYQGSAGNWLPRLGWKLAIKAQLEKQPFYVLLSMWQATMGRLGHDDQIPEVVVAN